MPEIQIRPVTAQDIPQLIQLDHAYTSEYAWQMSSHLESGHLGAAFQEVHLPRAVRVEYPRPPSALAADWQDRSGILVAILDGSAVGYASLSVDRIPFTAWMSDLVVSSPLRRRGIGSALVLAALEWAGSGPNSRRLMLEMQPKNQSAIGLAQKMGFEFCGYIDRYYLNQDPAILFAKLM